jgi:hypothetical protein
MSYLNKIARICWLILLVPGSLSQAVLGSENEIKLTAAIREGVGALRFSSYNQNAGLIQQGDKLEFRFAFSETNDASVRILGVHQQCGCLSQSLKAGQEIVKAQQGELIVKLDTNHFTGVFDKELVILTNETRDRPHVFRMQAKIERLITVRPPLVELEVDRQEGKNRVARLKVMSTSKQTLHIEKVVYNEDTLDIQYHPVQGAWELQVRWKGSAATANVNETIELLTNGPVKTLKIPVVGLRGRASRFSSSAPH